MAKKIDKSDLKTLRRIAHHLDSVVTVSDGGISEGVLSETNRALDDHELIKVRIADADRSSRTATIEALAAAAQAQVVQKIGKVAVLFRANPKANPKLSNLNRYAGGA